MEWIKDEKFEWREFKPKCLEVRRVGQEEPFLISTIESLINDSLEWDKIQEHPDFEDWYYENFDEDGKPIA